MHAAHVSSALEDIPVDFFGDPDGCWDYDQLARIAGFDPASLERAGVDQAEAQLSIGALTEPYAGFPDGAAVVMFTSADRRSIALVDCVGNLLQNELLQSELLQSELTGEPRNDSWRSAHEQASRIPRDSVGSVFDDRRDVAA